MRYVAYPGAKGLLVSASGEGSEGAEPNPVPAPQCGFAWGGRSQGSEALARAILELHLGSAESAEPYVRRFERQVVSEQDPAGPFTVTSEFLDVWMEFQTGKDWFENLECPSQECPGGCSNELIAGQAGTTMEVLLKLTASMSSGKIHPGAIAAGLLLASASWFDRLLTGFVPPNPWEAEWFPGGEPLQALAAELPGFDDDPAERLRLFLRLARLGAAMRAEGDRNQGKKEAS